MMGWVFFKLGNPHRPYGSKTISKFDTAKLVKKFWLA